MKAEPILKSGRSLLEPDAVSENLSRARANAATFTHDSFQINRILVAVDFSALSKKAIRYAAQFTHHKGGHIILLHVVEPKPHRGSRAKPSPGGFSRMDQAEQKLLELGEQELGPGPAFDLLVQTGEPYREIINAAKALSVGLIILATRGQTGLKRALEGSTAERVVRHAPCPVLVVPEEEHPLVSSTSFARLEPVCAKPPKLEEG
jgi:universal stress protein A